MGRTRRFDRGRVNGRYRRILLKNSASEICDNILSCAGLTAFNLFNFRSMIGLLLHQVSRNRGGSKLLRLGAAVGDPALLESADDLREGMTLLALIEPNVATPA